MFLFIRTKIIMSIHADKIQPALCLLTKIPNQIWLNFLETFSNYDIYVVIDDNSTDYVKKYGGLYKNIKIIQIENEICKDNGYTNCNSAVGFPDIIAWDKALYLFCELETRYCQVWFIEDDVFLDNEDVLIRIDRHCQHSCADLLTSFHELNLDGNIWSGWNHWVNVVDRIAPPWAHSMVCACRISKSLLEKIREYKQSRGHLFFIEAMFNTIADQSGLNIQNPGELTTIHWNTTWNIHAIDKRFLYHPIKCIDDHLYIRGLAAATVEVEVDA